MPQIIITIDTESHPKPTFRVKGDPWGYFTVSNRKFVTVGSVIRCVVKALSCWWDNHRRLEALRAEQQYIGRSVGMMPPERVKTHAINFYKSKVERLVSEIEYCRRYIVAEINHVEDEVIVEYARKIRLLEYYKRMLQRVEDDRTSFSKHPNTCASERAAQHNPPTPRTNPRVATRRAVSTRRR